MKKQEVKTKLNENPQMTFAAFAEVRDAGLVSTYDEFLELVQGLHNIAEHLEAFYAETVKQGFSGTRTEFIKALKQSNE